MSIIWSQLRLPAGALLGSNSGQVVHTHVRASVTKQYNLVPAKGRSCSAAGKVTVGLVGRRTGHASQTKWSIHLLAQRGQCARDEHHTNAPLYIVWSSFTLYLFYVFTMILAWDEGMIGPTATSLVNFSLLRLFTRATLC